jgi:hypothetical protein
MELRHENQQMCHTTWKERALGWALLSPIVVCVPSFVLFAAGIVMLAWDKQPRSVREFCLSKWLVRWRLPYRLRFLPQQRSFSVSSPYSSSSSNIDTNMSSNIYTWGGPLSNSWACWTFSRFVNRLWYDFKYQLNVITHPMTCLNTTSTCAESKFCRKVDEVKTAEHWRNAVIICIAVLRCLSNWWAFLWRFWCGNVACGAVATSCTFLFLVVGSASWLYAPFMDSTLAS